MVDACAALLVEGFERDWPGSWPDLAAGRDEVLECAVEGWIARAALDDNGALLGWIGGRPEYDGNVWQLHPLVVSATRRRAGIGRALVDDLAVQAGKKDEVVQAAYREIEDRSFVEASAEDTEVLRPAIDHVCRDITNRMC